MKKLVVLELPEEKKFSIGSPSVYMCLSKTDLSGFIKFSFHFSGSKLKE